LIQKASRSDDREMYQVFNMGTRMEIYTDEKEADKLIAVSKKFAVEARVIGRVEASPTRSLLLKLKNQELEF